jgi:HTH-type transcriptional regulator/antitoxin HipB
MKQPDFFKQLTQILRDHRRQSGLTQRELAELAGVGKSTVYDLEHGKQSVQLQSLLKVLQVLNIQIAFSSPLLPQTHQE